MVHLCWRAREHTEHCVVWTATCGHGPERQDQAVSDPSARAGASGAPGHPGEEQAERVLASMDTNEDGTISEDEFVHFMKQMKAAESLGSVASQ